MSQLVKTRHQANFKDFKRFGAFKGLVEQKNTYSTRSCVNWAFFGTRGTRVLNWPTRAKKGPIYTQTRQINYYFKQVKRGLIEYQCIVRVKFAYLIPHIWKMSNKGRGGKRVSVPYLKFWHMCFRGLGVFPYLDLWTHTQVVNAATVRICTDNN
jgi:hypothetical protein